MSHSPFLASSITNPKHEQARYTLPNGSERVIYAQRVNGHVRLTDEPSDALAGARAYVIERNLDLIQIEDGTSAQAHMKALVADYVLQAELRGHVPAEPEHSVNRIMAGAERLPIRNSNPAPYYLLLESLQWDAAHPAPVAALPLPASELDRIRNGLQSTAAIAA